MKKVIIGIMLVITIMTMTGCSKEEEAKATFPSTITEEVIYEDVIVEDTIEEDIISLEQDYADGKISKEYYEEVLFNSQKN